jgi:hypothetical protein
MALIDNLNAINVCKQNIKVALEDKGVDMSNVKFSEYAEKIVSLQLGSGDGGSDTPIPSVDYIYSNGYIEGGALNEIINLTPYEIVLDNKGKFSIELTCPIEICVSNYENYDIIFTVEIPDKYQITDNGFEIMGIQGYEPYALGYKENPRYKTIVRNGVTYNSYVRVTIDSEDYNSEDVATDILYYRITIEEK